MEVMKKPREPEEAKDSSDEELFLRSDVRPGMLPPPHTHFPPSAASFSLYAGG